MVILTMKHVEFVENTLFKSYGEVCWSSQPSLLLDELSVDKRDSDGFFSRRLACRTSNRSYSSTDSSLVTVDYQQSFLAFFLRCVPELLIRHMHVQPRAIMWCNERLICQAEALVFFLVAICRELSRFVTPCAHKLCSSLMTLTPPYTCVWSILYWYFSASKI